MKRDGTVREQHIGPSNTEVGTQQRMDQSITQTGDDILVKEKQKSVRGSVWIELVQTDNDVLAQHLAPLCSAFLRLPVPRCALQGLVAPPSDSLFPPAPPITSHLTAWLAPCFERPVNLRGAKRYPIPFSSRASPLAALPSSRVPTPTYENSLLTMTHLSEKVDPVMGADVLMTWRMIHSMNE